MAAKRILYAVCGALCCVVSFLYFDMALFAAMPPAVLRESGAVPSYRLSPAIVVFAIAGGLLLFVAVRYPQLVRVPARAKYWFALCAVAIAGPLVADALNDAQHFHVGHLLLAGAIVALLHDALVSHMRGRKLAAQAKK